MAQYDTAGDIINYSAIECGLATVSDPFSSTAPEMIQLRTLLNMSGRELWTKHQWQQFITAVTLNTSTDIIPGTTNQMALPSLYGYWVNQTGWTPNNLGLGLPLGGPLSEAQWTTIVAQNLAASTIYLSFKIVNGRIYLLPDPPPATTNISFEYMSRAWVQPTGTSLPAARTDACTSSADTVLFESILMVKMLSTRYKEAKGFDSTASSAQFAAAFSAATTFNKPAPVLNMGSYQMFPLINVWTNTPPTGFGM